MNILEKDIDIKQLDANKEISCSIFMDTLTFGELIKILGLDDFYIKKFFDKLKRYGINIDIIFKQKINSPYLEHLSDDIEAWGVLVDTLYDFYIKKSNLNLEEKKYKKKISVIMPVYNTEKYLSEAIEGILNQSFKDFEFIIIDDCSNG
ncbi:MAG: glycosyltransferase [Candidatus Gracilibacteria bacterium]|nr:glycosyltransferase [Candidatus Gracilibacteria bacterium]